MHPAEAHLREVKRGYAAGYDAAEREIAAAVSEYLDGFGGAKGGGGSTRGGGAARDKYKDEPTFYGRKWRRVLNGVARAMYTANSAAIDRANDALAQAFADGADETAYAIYVSEPKGGGGQTRGGGAGRDKPVPYTAEVVLMLVKAKLIELGTRMLNRARDERYTRQRAQTIAASEAAMGTEKKDMPRNIARRVVSSVRGATDATAQAMIYGAYDSGAYQAGLDAQRRGIELEKTWLGIPDYRIRDSHMNLHNTTVPMAEVFHGFHGVLRFPHDPQAPPAEIYRCRCRLAIHLPGRAPRGSDGPLLPSQTAGYMLWRDRAIRDAGNANEIYRQHRERRG